MFHFPEKTHQGTRRRIVGDVKHLVDAGICDETDITIGNDTIPPLNDINIYVNSKLTGNYYCFVLPYHYPFNPPKLYVNSKMYGTGSHMLNEVFRRKLKLYAGIECFCCDSLLCKNNWSPRNTMKDIIEETERYKNACKKVVYSVIIDVIKRKYLNNDINIFRYF